MSEPLAYAHDRPSLLRHKGCWLTFATVIPLLIGMAWVVEDWTGRRFLEKTKARLVAEGLELDPAKVLPGPVPDEENFCAIPLLKGLGQTEGGGAEIEAIKEIKEKFFPKENRFLAPTSGRDTQIHWESWHDMMIDANEDGWLTKRSDEIVRDLLRALEAEAGISFNEMERALDRPFAVLVPSAQELWRSSGVLSETIFADFGSQLALERVLLLRALLAISAREPEAALSSFRILWRLAEAQTNHGTLIGGLLGAYLRQSALDVLWNAAAHSAFDETQWRMVHVTMAGYRMREQLSHVFATETLFSVHAYKDYRANPKLFFDPFGLGPGGALEEVRASAYRFIPGGWYDFNHANSLLKSWSQLTALKSPDLTTRFTVEGEVIHEEHGKRNMLGHDYFERQPTVDLAPIMSRQFRCGSAAHLAQVVVALERHHAAHQTYPETLDALVPDYLPQIPLDLDGRPLRYARDPQNGRYKVWSLGLNGTDESGTIVQDDPRNPQPWGGKQGDWVWEYPAAPAAGDGP